MEVVSVMYSVLENLKTALSTEPSGRAYNQYVDVIGVAGVLEPAEAQIWYQPLTLGVKQGI